MGLLLRTEEARCIRYLRIHYLELLEPTDNSLGHHRRVRGGKGLTLPLLAFPGAF